MTFKCSDAGNQNDQISLYMLELKCQQGPCVIILGRAMVPVSKVVPSHKMSKMNEYYRVQLYCTV